MLHFAFFFETFKVCGERDRGSFRPFPEPFRKGLRGKGGGKRIHFHESPARWKVQAGKFRLESSGWKVQAGKFR
ncbi:MAG: hypothetical protein IJD43_13875, partial [Thermoguttaceae bacterium]|nr:hypothetical protein [Thermoguttaceae bacterium]